MLDRSSAQEYATWFRCLADATRLQILHLLASAGRPMTVAEVTQAVDVGQSTVSEHLQRLAAGDFLLVDHVGASSLYRLNPDCLGALPTAADVIMARQG